MKNTSFLLLFLSLVCTFSACDISSLIDPIDYPPNNPAVLKGPQQKKLLIQPFTLTPTTNFPFSGQLSRYGSHYVLNAYNGSRKVAVLRSGTVLELPEQSPPTVFTDQTGTIWGFTQKDKQAILSRFENNSWSAYATIDNGSNYYGLTKIDPDAFYIFSTNGTIVWDIQQKVVKQTLTKENSRVITKNFLIGSDDQSFAIRNKRNQDLVVSWKFSDYVTTKQGISNTVWGAFEDAQQNVWIVLKDSNWDGVLLKYDGHRLQRLSLIPVGTYDSGRSVSGFFLDKDQNLWMTIDSVKYIYSSAGEWLLPGFDLVKNDYGLQVFVNEQGRLSVSDDQRFYLINQ